MAQLVAYSHGVRAVSSSSLLTPTKMDTTLYESLLRSAYRFLSFRPRSEKELSDFLQNKLVKWKVAGQISVKKTIERLRELGYVDDRKFVLWWIEQRSTFRPKGKRVVKMELLKKGISREIIEDVLSKAGNESPFDELMLAQKAVGKKLVIWTKLPLIEQKKKVYTFLAQRGFTTDIIQKLIDVRLKKD